MSKFLVKTAVCFLITVQILLQPCIALELDLSVDDEIRKNYNPSKLELDALPPLPSISPSSQAPSKPPLEPIEIPAAKPAGNLPPLVPADKKPLISKVDKSAAVRIKKGTKFKVKSSQAISDSSRIGTRLSFVSQSPVTQRYLTIPQGTVFKGEIADSHLPQLSGNGGLIVIAIDSIVIKGSTHSINAKITKVNHKKVFFNNIKGKRLYWKGVTNSLKPGTKFYKKMMKTTSKLADNPFTVLLSPVTVIAGVSVYAVNFVGSPLFGLFNKGGRISIPAGTEFEIKILDDIYLY